MNQLEQQEILKLQHSTWLDQAESKTLIFNLASTLKNLLEEAMSMSVLKNFTDQEIRLMLVRAHQQKEMIKYVQDPKSIIRPPNTK